MGTSTLEAFYSVPADWMILIGGLILLTAVALRLGTNVVCALGLAWLITPSVLALVPSAFFLSQFSSSLINAGSVVFLVVLTLLFFILYQLFSVSFEYNAPMPALACALGTSVIMLVVWAQTPALQTLWDFGSSVDALFLPQFYFWWLLGALGALVFSRI